MRKLFVFFLLFGLLMVGCSSSDQKDPSGPVFAFESYDMALDVIPAVPYEADFVYLERSLTAEDAFTACSIHTGNVGRYYRNDVILVCADPPEMNRGNHYNALLVQDGQLQELPRSYFLETVEICGTDFTVEFEYTLHSGQVIVTYMPVDTEGYRIMNQDAGENQCLLLFECAREDGTLFSYPVILNPETGVRTELLAVIGEERILPGWVGALHLSEDQKILAKTHENRYHYYNLSTGTAQDLSVMTGRTLETCSMADGKIICQDASDGFWSVDTDTMAVSQLELDIAEVLLFNGIHSAGNQTYLLYRDPSGALLYYDFLTMNGDVLSEPAGWTVSRDYLYPCYDGRKAFQHYLDQQGTYQVLIFDCDRKKLLLLSRENPNAVRESMISWTEDGELVITTDSNQEFYVYQWKEMKEEMNQTEEIRNSQYREEDFVPVLEYIPDLLVDMKYAFPDNFTGHTIYEFQEPYLRYGTVKKLMAAQEELKTMGYRLKLWDAFRPVSAQFKLWEILPDDTYVANPLKGFSPHSRGNTVDITMVLADGTEIEMPTEFDDFSTKADRDYSDNTQTAAANAMVLQTVMEKHGFNGYFGEWWHYVDAVRYEVEHIFDPSVISVWYADCQEYITLRSAADTAADSITRIPVREEVTLLGYQDAFALVDFRGQRGYVLREYLSQE